MSTSDTRAEPVLWPVDEAFAAVVADAPRVAGSERVSLADAAGRVTASSITSPIPLPPFDQSAMDGYGFHAADVAAGAFGPFPIVGRIRAGASSAARLESGSVVRLLTGAAIPDGVAAVIMEERVDVTADGIRARSPVKAGENIRRRGEDVATGVTIVEAGVSLDARHLALAAACGWTDVEVTRRVRIGLLSTGDELVEPGAPLPATGIHDSNRPMLHALLSAPSAEITDLGRLDDDLAAISRRLAECSSRFDLIITSGGVSGSDADHSVDAIRSAGGRSTRIALAVKPGKPMAFGQVGACRVLALAGNPLSALVGALLFARPLARHLSGETVRPAVGLAARAASVFHHRPGRTEYVPAGIVGRGGEGWLLVEKRGRGGSARLSPLVSADGIAVVPASSGDVEAGEQLEFHPFRTDFAL